MLLSESHDIETFIISTKVKSLTTKSDFFEKHIIVPFGNSSCIF